MSPSPSALFCLGLCLGQVPAQSRPLPKPTLQAVPSSLVPLEKPVTIRCQGPPGVDLYRLEKLRSGKYEDQAFLFIPAMKREHTGRYRCSYQNGSRWSPPSDQLELVATGVYDKPLLLAKPSPAVSPGGDVTLQCQTPYSFDQFALYKEGDPRPYRSPERWYLASFPIITVTAAHSGTYRCYSFSSSNPYMWSAPSNPLELVVTETFRNITSSPEESPIGDSCPAALHQGQPGPDMPWRCHPNTPGGASGGGLAQPEETPAAQGPSRAEAAPPTPPGPEVTGLSGQRSSRCSLPGLMFITVRAPGT
ncbi:platelet glycoprotein VI isoform 1 precursor, partial [Daubentonia madagascariensis]